MDIKVESADGLKTLTEEVCKRNMILMIKDFPVHFGKAFAARSSKTSKTRAFVTFEIITLGLENVEA